MNLAKVLQGRIITHFEGDSNLISYKSVDQESIVELPDWAKEIREENILKKVANIVLVWDYEQLKFVKHDEPHYEMFSIIMLIRLRSTRDFILSATDFITSALDTPFNDAQKTLVADYRQALRDLPALVVFDADTLKTFYQTNKDLPNIWDHFPEPPTFIQTIVDTAVEKGKSYPLDQAALNEALSHLNLIGLR